MDSEDRLIPAPKILIGTILVLVLLYLVVVWAGWRYLGWTIEQTRFYTEVGGALATVGLATGILYQGVLYASSLRESQKSRLVQQESEWIPKMRQPLQANWLLFSGSRPWYPWFNAEVNDEPSGWCDEIVRPISRYSVEEQVEDTAEGQSEPIQPLQWHEKQAVEIADNDIDWYIPFPNEIREFLGDRDAGVYSGKLYFRFKTITDEDYFFIYHIEYIAFDSGYRILRTPFVERIMPWEESEVRNELRDDLEPVIEESRELDDEIRAEYKAMIKSIED